MARAGKASRRRASGSHSPALLSKRTCALPRYGKVTRRAFTHALGGGALLSLAPSLSSGAAERHTLFFNFSNVNFANGAQSNSTHYFFISGRHYRLGPISEKPHLLARARLTNRFLTEVPDQQITHFAEGVDLPSDSSTLGYSYMDANTSTGTYSLTSLVQHVPAAGLAHAFGNVLSAAAGGSLPLSAKREAYGVTPALTLQDLKDEQVLVDMSDFARTLVGMHPDFLAANVKAAGIVQFGHVTQNQYTKELTQMLNGMGPAQPQGMTAGSGNPGWATLIPYTDPDGKVFKNSVNLNQYDTEWHPDLGPAVLKAVLDVNPKIKNDTSLGTNITGVNPDVKNPQLAGNIWYTHNGFSSFERTVQTTAGVEGEVPSVSFNTVNSSMGIQFIDNPTVSVNGDGTLTISLTTIRNWFLRFLSVYLQFKDNQGNVINPNSLPADVIKNHPQDVKLEYSQAAFAGFISPPNTIAGVPFLPIDFALTLNVPTSVSSISIFFGGIGNASIPPGAIDDNWIIVGATLTGLINYALVGLLMAAGAFPDIAPLIRFLFQGLLSEVIFELLAVTGSGVFEGGTVNVLSLVNGMVKALLNASVVPALARLITFVTGDITASQFFDAVPLVGNIARVVAAVVGAVQLAETSIEVGISPRIYEFGIALTHTVFSTVLPDPMHGALPTITSNEVLYYRTIYLFGSGGVPHKGDPQDIEDPAHAPSLVIRLDKIPSGGQIEVRIALYIRQKGASVDDVNNFCAAQGTTNLTDNTVSQLPTIVLTENRRPIQANTQYQHVMKTTLDETGNHLWLETSKAPVYTAPAGNQQPGSLGALRNITVRQMTAAQPGYVGYAWQSYSSGVNDCMAGAPAQVDVAANLNTSSSNSGKAAQSGYARLGCGLSGGSGGVSVAYSLLSNNAQNFYLDTDTRLVRQVRLDNPAFDPPGAPNNMAFGKLNFDSDKLVLHPSGHLVSINGQFHKCESHRVPANPLPDASASSMLIASPFSGLGERPGLITSPVSLAASIDGHVLVLEDSAYNNRIQAMDLGGNPIPLFANQSTPYFLVLTETAQYLYLDIAVEFSGFIYVLSQSQDASDFRVDVYHPTQQGTKPITTTRGIYGAKLAVDYWRGLYTLNYEVLQLPNGNVPMVTEPSVSYWYPQLPTSA